VDGTAVEAPLEGTLIVVRNADLPGVIGEVGTILGRHGVNIANFALGRGGSEAVGVVNVDDGASVPDVVLDEIRAIKAVRDARIVRL
jgi:D-3-phosphoglycerate dehydrogenase